MAAPPKVPIDVVVGSQVGAGLRLRLGAFLVEFDQDQERGRVLERAEPLRPAQEDGDVLDANEETDEQELGNEDWRDELHRLAHVGDPTGHHERGGRGCEAQAPECEQVQAEVAPQLHQPEHQEKDDQALHKPDAQLRGEAPEEVVGRGVGAADVLAELRSKRLAAAEHHHGGDQDDPAKVCREIVGIGVVIVADALQNKCENEIQENGRTEPRPEGVRVAQGVL
eukprot:scaffold4614_cov247-Pinguiococcus_pyrenoidosus.AAC.6